MADRWTNSKGKIFTGQTASVPAPEDKSAVVVDYDEWKLLELIVTRVGAVPTQGGNGAPQPVAISAILKKSGAIVPSWSYDVALEDGGGTATLTFGGVVPVSGGITANAIFPAGVTTGKIGTVKAISGGRIGTLVITVA